MQLGLYKAITVARDRHPPYEVCATCRFSRVVLKAYAGDRHMLGLDLLNRACERPICRLKA